MPLPRPRKNETKDKFISRCMENKISNKEFPDTDQRYAMCNTRWKRGSEDND